MPRYVVAARSVWPRRHHARRRGGLLPDRVHARTSRPVSPRIRHRCHHRNAYLALRLVYDHADARRALGARVEVEALALFAPFKLRLSELPTGTLPTSYAGASASVSCTRCLRFVVRRAVALVSLGFIGEEFIPPEDRGEIFLQLVYPTGTPLSTVQVGALAAEHVVDQSSDLSADATVAGAYAAPLGGFRLTN